MNALGDNSLVRLSLAVAACVAVGMISYQQGQIQAATPKEGQYVTSLVFTATMGNVDTKLAALSDAQDLRLKLIEQELARVREDVARLRDYVASLIGENNVQDRR